MDGGAEGDAAFCTKMVTVEPFAAVPLAVGCWLKTVPLATCAGLHRDHYRFRWCRHGAVGRR